MSQLVYHFAILTPSQAVPTLSSSQFSSQLPSFLCVRRWVRCLGLRYTARTPANSGEATWKAGSLTAAVVATRSST